MNDNRPRCGSPGIAGGPPAPARLGEIRYAGGLAAQAGIALVVLAIALIADGLR